MSFLSSIFRSRDKPTDSTSGSAYRFFLGGTTSGKTVTERIAFDLGYYELVDWLTDHRKEYVNFIMTGEE